MRPRTPRRLFSFDRGESRGLEGRMAGVDEAGRGPLAGPVVAAAVILFRPSPFRGLNDSKQVPAPLRQTLFLEIARSALIGIGVVDEKKIDEVNIYQATRLAMRQAVLALSRTPNLILVDGNMTIDLPVAQKSIVKGDQKSASIAAASIVAKVYRDAWMRHLDGLYPGYQFKDHKGYPTPAHLELLQRLGPCEVHRKSFSPVETFFSNSL